MAITICTASNNVFFCVKCMGWVRVQHKVNAFTVTLNFTELLEFIGFVYYYPVHYIDLQDYRGLKSNPMNSKNLVRIYGYLDGASIS